MAFKPARTRVLDALIRLCKKYRHVYATQEKIAKMANIHRVTAHNELHALEELGFIAIKNNGANKSCWYKISDFFLDEEVQKNLSRKLPIFYFTIYLLLSALNREATRSINDFNFIKIQQQQSSICTMSSDCEEGDMLLEKIQRECNFDEHEVIELSKIDVVLLKKAYEILKNTNGVRYKFRFLLKVCENLKSHRILNSKNIGHFNNKDIVKNQNRFLNQNEVEKNIKPNSSMSDNGYVVENSPTYKKMKHLESTRIPIDLMTDSQLDEEIANWKKNIEHAQTLNPLFRESQLTLAKQCLYNCQQEKIKRLIGNPPT